MSNNEGSRIDRLEALAQSILEGLAESKQRTDALAKAIEALATETKQRTDSNAKAIEALTNALSQEREERIKDKNLYQQTIADMQRQFIDIGRRTDSNSADIRELIIENQRILRYLESLVNKTGDNS